MLIALLITTFAGIGLFWALPLRWVRSAALLLSLVGVAFGLALWQDFDLDSQKALQFDLVLPWIPAIGAQWILGVDGVSLAMVLLTGIAAVAGVLFSWNQTHQLRAYFSLYFLLIGAVYGVFISHDLLLFFAFYELAIIPKYFLIAHWGSTRREYGAMKLVLYSLVGSAPILFGVVALPVLSGHSTFSLAELSQHSVPAGAQSGLFLLFFLGFGILAGLWPFHTWAPTGHVAAPTPASMLLAGVIMKLGAYGIFRVAMTLCPEGMVAWRSEFSWLAIGGIIFGALAALVQRDLKFVIGYSSISHMGFVLLGFLTMNDLGVTGALFQMVSHGLLAGVLFAVVGRVVYDRTHTRDLTELGKLGLGTRLGFASSSFFIASLASMGLPGFSGFIAELHILAGVWQFRPTYAVIAILGILLGGAYLLRAHHDVFKSSQDLGLQSPSLAQGSSESKSQWIISLPERIGIGSLLGLSLFLGLYPAPLLELIQSTLGSPAVRSALKGGVF